MHEFICGNAYDSLQSLPSESIHCVVTSPPYWMQRKSLVDGQIGVENHLNEYLDNLVDVFDEVYRVLRPDGTMWLNLGDVYVSDKKYRVPIGLKQKDLIGLPWRVAFELQESGWYLRGDCIWSKPNAMPSAARDRPNRSHEYVFLMSKQGNYFYDQDAVMEPAVVGTRNRRSVWEINTQPSPVNHYAAFPEALAKVCIEAGTSERGCCPKCGGQVVRVTTSKRLRRDELDPSDPRYRPNRYKGAYSDINGRGDAGYTERATVGWTPSCGCDAEETAPCVVLDPFGGTGTVSKVARDLGRSSIMIDINPEYVDIAKRRLGVQERG